MSRRTLTIGLKAAPGFLAFLAVGSYSASWYTMTSGFEIAYSTSPCSVLTVPVAPNESWEGDGSGEDSPPRLGAPVGAPGPSPHPEVSASKDTIDVARTDRRSETMK